MRVWTCSRGFWDSYDTHALDEFDNGTSPDTDIQIDWNLLGVIEVFDDKMRDYDTVIWVLLKEVAPPFSDYG
jgi:hypothetical protein